MSPSAYITTRVVKAGKRYVVRFRRGGRMTKLEHAGSFKSLRDARARRDLVTGELAAGRDPLVAIRAAEQPTQVHTLDERFGAFIDSRVDVTAKTKLLYEGARARLGALAERDPATVTTADVQEWVAANADLAPGSLAHYLSSLAQALDFADVEPNPARSRKVKLPSGAIDEISPPSNVEWEAIKASGRPRIMLALRLMECLGLRVSEAVDLTYGDVDFAGAKLRISKARTKGRTAGQRWLAVPAELLDEIAALCPLEDRTRDRRVFASITSGTIRAGLDRACRDAGIAHYSPHDLRHRRISLWIAHGFDPVTAKTWAGHSRASMTIDRYAHVVIDARGEEWREFWLGAYEAERRLKVAEPETVEEEL